MPRRRSRPVAEIIRDGSLLGLVLCERLPRDQPTGRLDECMKLGREFAVEQATVVDDNLARIVTGEDFGLVLDALVEELLVWARARTGIDFLAHDPCPY